MIQSFEGFNAFFWVFFSLSHALQPHCDNLFVTLLLEKYNKELSMKLSELHTGESGIIVKVTGHGGFRKRIVEMGFIKGQKVEVLLNAPLKDTVKYRVMGYEVSLRHSEANMIEVMTQEEYTRRMKAKSEAVTKDETTQAFEEESEQINNSNSTDEQALPHKHVSDDELKAAAERESHVINVALVGNPNCGKTSLFNFASGAHERVGNYSGVTVDAKEGHAEFEGYEFNLVDLPGTYSMSAYSWRNCMSVSNSSRKRRTW